MSSMLSMETRRAADVRATSPFTNPNVVVDVTDDAAMEAVAVAMAMEEDAVMEAMVKEMGRKMTT